MDHNDDAGARPEKLSQVDALLGELNDAELAKTWAHSMRIMRQRGLVRTASTPVGDYAERITCARLNLERKGFSEKSIDAIDASGTRYQIKGRRLTPENTSRQLSAIRDIESGPFDILLAVFFNEDLDLEEIWSIPLRGRSGGRLRSANELHAHCTYASATAGPSGEARRLSGTAGIAPRSASKVRKAGSAATGRFVGGGSGSSYS